MCGDLTEARILTSFIAFYLSLSDKSLSFTFFKAYSMLSDNRLTLYTYEYAPSPKIIYQNLICQLFKSLLTTFYNKKFLILFYYKINFTIYNFFNFNCYFNKFFYICYNNLLFKLIFF
jgi:hypothetical protein